MDITIEQADGTRVASGSVDGAGHVTVRTVVPGAPPTVEFDTVDALWDELDAIPVLLVVVGPDGPLQDPRPVPEPEDAT